MKNDAIYAVVMAGGRGTRFWPASREKTPKQVLSIAGDAPLIRATVDRILPLVAPDRIIVITGEAHAEPIMGILNDIPAENIVVEPVGRNTAPCVGLAAHIVAARNPEGIMLVLPADHVINKTDEFLDIVRTAARHAAEDSALVTLGIKPAYPETGYGYIEAEDHIDGWDRENVLRVVKFHEKPEIDKAAAYLESGRFYWNSGMFIWKARTILRWIGTLLPDVGQRLQELAASIGRDSFDADLKRIYPGLTSISIDFGIMEKADGVLVIPADIGWSDVGSWNSAAEYWPEQGGNALVGDVLFVESNGCAVYSPEKTVVLIGVEDLIVVDTPDALLVCPKKRAQDVGQIVQMLKEQNRTDLI